MSRVVQQILNRREVRDLLYRFGLENGPSARHKAYLAAALLGLAGLIASVNLLRDPRPAVRVDAATRKAEQALVAKMGVSTQPDPSPAAPPGIDTKEIPAGRPRPAPR